jgi:hypothetical protein
MNKGKETLALNHQVVQENVFPKVLVSAGSSVSSLRYFCGYLSFLTHPGIQSSSSFGK